MIADVNGWSGKSRLALSILLLFIICAPGGWPAVSKASAKKYQGAGSPPPAKIMGFDPGVVDIGQPVRMRVSSRLSETYSLLVGDVPVSASIGKDPQWVTFTVPTSVVQVEFIKVTLIDGGQSSSAPLRINPLKILQVDPDVAAPGDRILLTIHPSGLSLVKPEVTFNSVNTSATGIGPTSPSSALQVVSQEKLAAIVPENVPAGAVSLVVVVNGRPSLAYNAFRVRRVFPWYQAFGLALAVAAFIAFVLWWYRRPSVISDRRISTPTRATQTEPTPTGPAPTEPTLNVPSLEVPQELVDACLRGQCVLYAGAGLSARAGLPTWRAFVEGLLKWAEAENLIEPSFSHSLEQALERGGVDRVADNVVNAVTERSALEKLSDYLNQIFGNAMTLPDIHRILPEIKFSAALTTNFDGLIEQTFSGQTPEAPVYVPSDVDGMRSSFSVRQFFVLKLYGTLQRPDSLLVSPAQFLDKIRSDRPFSDFVQQLFHSRTLLFLGSSFAGIEAYLAPLNIRLSAQIRHYAVVAVNDASWQADADSLERRYGIRVLPYVASARHGEVLTFVRELREKIATSKSDTLVDDVAQDTEQAAVVLTNLELHNIGPFERLELSFTRRWTVLLGDNGVGKSSVLRAIAAAVAGDQAGEAGARLLRSGQSEGYIQLTTKTNDRYRARLSLNSLKRPEIISEGASGLGGSLLVLAFPAVRTMASGRTKGPEFRNLTQPPTPDDVLPALEAMPDPRVLGFKQWLTNLDYAKTKSPELARRVDAVMGTLTGALGILLGGMQLNRIEVLEKDVFVHTEDGRLSLDALSQGTISILGWVGVLVQRLAEVSEIANGRGLVLLDEIDAHMHPEWQQAIISRLVEAFPFVQFIVSTHSPFLAVGRRAEEIIRFRRDALTRKVIAERADQDTTDMTVADVLTSYLFGLQTAVGHDLQKDVLRLRDLSLRQDLATNELEDLRRLETKLDAVGVADTQADPLYGRFVEELTKQKAAQIASLPPLSKKAEERQRELTKQIAQRVLRDARSREEKRAQ
jgi:predicted ATPase